jgi:hypothetical protein
MRRETAVVNMIFLKRNSPELKRLRYCVLRRMFTKKPDASKDVFLAQGDSSSAGAESCQKPSFNHFLRRYSRYLLRLSSLSFLIPLLTPWPTSRFTSLSYIPLSPTFYAVILYISFVVHRVSTEINFVGISIGIPIEISFDFRRN